MHFLLSSMSVVYVLTTHILEDGGNDATVEQIRKGLNGTMMTMSAEDSLEAKYMVEDDQIRSSLFTQHNMNMDKAIQVSCIIDKLPPSWKDFKHTLKHLKEELTLVELGSHLRIEESLRMQDSDKPKGNNVAGPLVFNIVEHNNFSRKLGHLKKDCKGGKVGNKTNGSGINGLVDGSTNSLKGAIVHACKDRCWFKTYKSLNDGYILYIGNESTALVHRLGCVDLKFSSGKDCFIHARLGYVRFKRMQDMSKDRLIPAFDMDTERFVRLPDPKLKTLGKRGIECIFVGYVEHSKAFRFSSVPRPSLRILNGAEDIGGLVVPGEVTEEKEAINEEMDSIMGNNTWVLADLPPGCKPLGCKWIFKRKLKVDGTTKKFKARVVIQGFKQNSGIHYFDTYAPVARISTIRLLIAMTSIQI
ncbi:zinc finger, CCHC-type containing protein [Tanacetum coccineum]